MFGVIIVTKDENLQKRLEMFCQNRGLIIRQKLNDLKLLKKDAQTSSVQYVFVDNACFKIEEVKNLCNLHKNIKWVIFLKGIKNIGDLPKNMSIVPYIRFAKQLDEILQKQNYFCVDRKTNQVVELKKIVSTFCLEAGIMPHLSGYKYVVCAIMHTILDIENAKYLTKQVYPKVAKKFGVSSSIVERTIRHALIVAGKTGKLVKINELLDADVFKPYERMSNGQFIFLVADRFLFDLKIMHNENMLQ